MPQQREAIVIGGGVTGAAILHALVQRGIRNPLLIERGPLCSGVTGVSGATVRSYDRDPYLCALAAQSLPDFTSFEALTGYSCGFKAIGSLYFELFVRRELIEKQVSILRAMGRKVEILTRSQGERRFPQMSWDGVELAIHEPEAGYADPLRTSQGWVASATKLGATFMPGVEVEGLVIVDGRVCGVRTSAGTISSSVVIVAAGAWSQELLARHGIFLPMWGKPLQVNRFARPSEAPPHPAFFDVGTLSFGRHDGDSSLAGCKSEAAPTGPDTEQKLDPAAAATSRQFLSQRVKGMDDAPLTGGVRAVESYTADRRGLLGPLALPGLFIAAAWSGGGFKIAPAVGRRIAEMAARALEVKSHETNFRAEPARR